MSIFKDIKWILWASWKMSWAWVTTSKETVPNKALILSPFIEILEARLKQLERLAITPTIDSLEIFAQEQSFLPLVRGRVWLYDATFTMFEFSSNVNVYDIENMGDISILLDEIIEAARKQILVVDPDRYG